MAAKPIPSPDELRQHFTYDPSTGVVIRLTTGRRACTTITSHGYLVFSFKGKQIYAHRAAWCLHYGNWPEQVIDHVNKNKRDNRILNLRDVDQSTNMRNQRRSSANRSGTTGVFYSKPYRLWTANIKHGGQSVFLGRFDTVQEAKAARKAAEICLGFHPAHGDP